MANMDNVNVSEGDGAQVSAPGAGGRRYRKKDQKHGSAQSGDSTSNTSQKGADRDEPSAEGDVEIQKIKLNRLSNYEVDNVKMANVFGNHPEKGTKPVSSSMRLNPLYDQDGHVEVTADQAQVAKLADNSSQDSVGLGEASGGGGASGKKGTYKRPKKGAEVEEAAADEVKPPETKINYSKNFRFGKRSTDGENGAANGVKKLTSFGVVMPSRVKQNTIPKDQLVTAGSGPSQYALGAKDKGKSDLEAAGRRHEMRRRWRYVIILILIILVFGLILTVVLYFATRPS